MGAEGGALATVTGWGHIHDGSQEISEVLRYVHDMPVMTNEACKPQHPLIMEGHLCMETTGGKGPCIGDAGGPLVTKKGGLEGPGQVWVQHGIVSFGSINGCEFWSPRRAAWRDLGKCGSSTESSPSVPSMVVSLGRRLVSAGSPTTLTGSSPRSAVNYYCVKYIYDVVF